MCHSQDSSSLHSHVADMQVTSSGQILVSVPLQELKHMQDQLDALRAENAALKKFVSPQTRTPYS